MSIFVGKIQALISRVGPYFIHGPNIGKFLEAVGMTLDGAFDSLQYGLLLSNPLKCDPSALPVLSVDRTIRLYPTEPEASKRLRLSQWLQLHRQRATQQGEMRHSQPYFLPDTPVMRIVHQAGDGSVATWHTLQADGTYEIHQASPSNWNYDAHPNRWWRIFVILYAPASVLSPAHYDDGTLWDDGTVWDGLTTAAAQDMVNMILEWKGKHEHLMAYILATDPASFDPTVAASTDPSGWTSLPIGNWGSPVGAGGAMTRLPSAVWIYEG